MKRLLTGAVAFSLLAGVAGVASADDRRDDGYRGGSYQYNQDYRNGNDGRYDNGARWSAGQRISQRDWDRGQTLNYRDYNLAKAPKGYEWREIDGNYIQAPRGGGLIVDVVVSRNGYRNGQYDYNNGQFDNSRGHRHHWRSGERIEQRDWQRGEPVDYREHNLRKPRRGYEWREVDGSYIEAAILTGVIISVIAAQN